MVEPNAAADRTQAAMPIRRLAGLVLLYCCAVLALFHETAWSIVAIWLRSDTFAHGFLIVPIALWLGWQKRFTLAGMPPQGSIWPLILLLPMVSLWLLASLIDVLVIQQIAFVAVLVLGIWAIVGNAIAGVILFPLMFLFLAVPMGENLIPPLMEFTASSTVWMVQMTGVPVYREGMYFSLPSGNWSVVEACSGVRYLIASYTLGLLYAYLTYKSLSRRILFVLASVVVPIFANSVRAYMIVMLGHVSNMTIAVGVDHLLYGWVFFGLVMMLLFWLGSIWAESDVLIEASPKTAEAGQSHHAFSASPVFGLLAALLVAATGPVLVASIEKLPATTMKVELSTPPASESWQLVNQQQWGWQPINPGADRELVQYYQSGEQIVALYLQQYFQQTQGVELVGSSRKFVEKNSPWHITSRQTPGVEMKNDVVSVDSVNLRSASGELLVWSWYRIGSRYTTNVYVAKLLEAYERISFSQRGSARIVVATNSMPGGEPDQRLQSFLAAYLPAIEASLDNVVVDD